MMMLMMIWVYCEKKNDDQRTCQEKSNETHIFDGPPFFESIIVWKAHALKKVAHIYARRRTDTVGIVVIVIFLWEMQESHHYT